MKPSRVALPLSLVQAGALSLLTCSCDSEVDTVFYPLLVEFEESSGSSPEGDAEVFISLKLSHKSDAPVSVNYRLVDIEASGHELCGAPDYSTRSGSLTFAPGETTQSLSLRFNDDSFPEIDESFRVELSASKGVQVGSQGEYEHTILDDDRGALIDVVQDFGAKGDGSSDDTDAIQAAIEEADSSDAAVVYFPPGEYLITSLELSRNANYFGYGATLLQAPGQADDATLLQLQYAAESDSEPIVFQGFTIDGQRDLQGDFSDWEVQNSSLFTLASDPDQAGRLRLLMEDVVFQQTGGNALVLGTNTDSTLCQLRGDEVFTDVIKLRGGGSQLTVRDLTATATVGTAGIALTGSQEGFEGTQRVEVLLEDLILTTGDLEIDVRDGSELKARRLTLERAPFYLRALQSSVHISDSSFVIGVPLYRFNRIVAPKDVHFENCSFALSEFVDPSVVLEEADRVLSAIEVTWNDVDYAYSDEEEDRLVETLVDQRLLFEGCDFQLSDNIDDGDTAYVAGVLGTADPSNSLVIEGGSFAEDFEQVLGPSCEACTFTP